MKSADFYIEFATHGTTGKTIAKKLTAKRPRNATGPVVAFNVKLSDAAFEPVKAHVTLDIPDIDVTPVVEVVTPTEPA